MRVVVIMAGNLRQANDERRKMVDTFDTLGIKSIPERDHLIVFGDHFIYFYTPAFIDRIRGMRIDEYKLVGTIWEEKHFVEIERELMSRKFLTI